MAAFFGFKFLLVFAVVSSFLGGSEAFFWKEKGTELSCDVTCGSRQAAVSGPAVGNSTYVPYVCAVNGSTFDKFTTGTQVGTLIYVSNVLSCWVYSGNPGGPSSTPHSSWYCLCADANDQVKNATGSTAESCTSTCSTLATFNSTLTSCLNPAPEPICYDDQQSTFGYQNASAQATDRSCLTVSLPASTSPQSPPATRLPAFSCLCTTPSAVTQVSLNCTTSSSFQAAVSSKPAESVAGGASPGKIAGGVVAGVVGVVLLIALALFLRRKRMARARDEISIVNNPFSKIGAQMSIQSDHHLVDFDLALTNQKKVTLSSSEEASTSTSTPLQSGLSPQIQPAIASANFAEMQDRFGTKAANLPTPSSGSEQSSSPDGIQSFKLHHRKDSDEDSDWGKLEDTWKIDPKDLQCRMSNGAPVILGQGGFGKVYLGILHREDVAIKVITSHTQKQQERFLREIRTLRACHNTHIVQFMGACVREKQTFMAMQYMAGGDLLTKLSSDSEMQYGWYRKGRQITLDIAKGLIYLHSKHIAHLDLKSPNVMLTANDEAKIGDVGLGKLVANPNAIATQQGSFLWAAPEQLNGGVCSTASDVFSFGTVIWEICTHDLPVNRAMRPMRIPEEAPQPVADLVRMCHQLVKEKRPSAVEVHDLLLKASR